MLQPENVLVRLEKKEGKDVPQLKLSDFGRSRSFDETQNDCSTWLPGVILYIAYCLNLGFVVFYVTIDLSIRMACNNIYSRNGFISVGGKMTKL